MKKKILLPILFLVLLTVCLSFLFPAGMRHYEQNRFDQFTTQQYEDLTANETLSPSYFDTSNPKTEQLLVQARDNLLSFRRNRLTSVQQQTYDIYLDYLNTEIEDCNYILYQNYFTPNSGIHITLPTTLSEYSFSTETEIRNYLRLIQQTDSYFEQLLSIEKKKAENGLFMKKRTANFVIIQCRTFTQPEQNYWITHFNKKINSCSFLSEEKKQSYIEENKSQVLSHVIPAYENIIATLSKCKRISKHCPLSTKPLGRQYYEHLARKYTGSSMPVKEMMTKIDNRISRLFIAISDTETEDPQAGTLFLTEELHIGNPKETLAHLKKASEKDFPPIAQTDVQIFPVPKQLRDSNTLAYYPVLQNRDKVPTIYINPDCAGESLYSTLAHEGYPGHLYQEQYFQSQNPVPLLTLLDYEGYTEGWATYAELTAYDYYPFSGHSKSLTKLNRLQADLQLAIIARADIGINYQGWSQKRARRFFSQVGITDEPTIRTLYQFLEEEPASYLKYCVGYLEVLRLRKKVKRALGDTYQPILFHQAFLASGPAPFAIVEKGVDFLISGRYTYIG
ncbi:MAG: DUF885 domain-containing protein [Lachnospiraceae bacterium]